MTTLNPLDSTCFCIRLATSLHHLRRGSSSMAICSVSSPTFKSRAFSGDTWPMGRVMARSAHHPASRQAVSIFNRSPSLRGRLPGMPWTTCSLKLAQITAGKGVLPG